MKTAIVTDSGCGLSKVEMNALGIYYLPLQVFCDEKEYLDGVEITIEQFYDMLRAKKAVKTSMPPVGMMIDVIEQIKTEGFDEIIFIPLTAGISSTATVFMATAQDEGIPCFLVDCFTTLGMQSYLTRCAKELVDQGKSAQEIVALLQASIMDSDTMIIPDDLSQLKAGGRLTPMAAALAGLLKIKPILKMNASCEGKIDVYEKVRTMSKSLSKVLDLYATRHLDENHIFFILESATEHVDDVVSKVKELFPKVDVRVLQIPAVIAAHTGLGCLGLQYVRKVPGCNS